MSAPEPSLTRAVLWMMGWLLAMFTMAVAGREAGSHMHVFQLMELRGLIGIALLLPVIHFSCGLAAMRTDRPLTHIGRNAVHYGAQFCWFQAILMISLAEVVSIEFTMPLWTALLAALFIGERLNGWKLIAITIGIVGVFVIVRPVARAIEPGQLIALGAAIGFSISVVMVKSMTRTETVLRILFWMVVIQSIIGAVPAWLVWQPVPSQAWGWVVLVAVCATFSHYCMARAMTYADATFVVPIDFLRVPLTAAAGWLIYAEMLDALTVAGTALILFGNLLNLRGTRRVH